MTEEKSVLESQFASKKAEMEDNITILSKEVEELRNSKMSLESKLDEIQRKSELDLEKVNNEVVGSVLCDVVANAETTVLLNKCSEYELKIANLEQSIAEMNA